MQYPEPSPAAGICRTIPGGGNMPYSLLQNELIAPRQAVRHIPRDALAMFNATAVRHIHCAERYCAIIRSPTCCLESSKSARKRLRSR